jgi:hypothetical protein
MAVPSVAGVPSIPGWIRPGAVITYDTFGAGLAGVEQITVTTVSSTTVAGTVETKFNGLVDHFSFSATAHGSSTGYPAQFWVDPADATQSIFGPNGETYTVVGAQPLTLAGITWKATYLQYQNPNNGVEFDVVFDAGSGLILAEDQIYPDLTAQIDFTGIAGAVLPDLAPPPPSRLALAARSDSGVKGDDITRTTRPTITGKGKAGDKITLFDGKNAVGTATVAADGSWSVTLKASLAAGTHSLTATESGKSGTSAASAVLKLTIKTSAPAPSLGGVAVFADKGAAGDTIATSGLGEVGDTVTLFDGKTKIGTTTVAANGIWSLGTPKPLAPGRHSLSASELDVAGNKSSLSPTRNITIRHAASNAVIFIGTPGLDVFIGGAGHDIFEFSAANLASTDQVSGKGGQDELEMTTAGRLRTGKINGVETYVLANGPGNVLSLSNGNFAGTSGKAITVDGGNAGDTLRGVGVAVVDKAVLKGGAGADTLVAGPNATMTGGNGKDLFEFTTPGSAKAPDRNTITDFTHGTDKIGFSEKGFGLGAKLNAATLFKANRTGSFTTTTQRFAYDTASGALFYDVHGSASPNSRLEIAALTNHPTLTVGDITFVG